ncbi:MAG: hypothetical protein KI793_29000 [Rivularia sp. (in: Bacteria)]|nr:hypothetical protein [Rivularia sp. MS3]
MNKRFLPGKQGKHQQNGKSNLLKQRFPKFTTGQLIYTAIGFTICVVVVLAFRPTPILLTLPFNLLMGILSSQGYQCTCPH